MKMTWFGHSCFRIETGASALLINPFLKSSPSFQKSGLAFEAAIKGVTHVAITRGHDDATADAWMKGQTVKVPKIGETVSV